MSEPKIREVRATDLPCSTCAAPSGLLCTNGEIHDSRMREAELLRRDGWLWQERNLFDAGSKRSK